MQEEEERSDVSMKFIIFGTKSTYISTEFGTSYSYECQYEVYHMSHGPNMRPVYETVL